MGGDEVEASKVPAFRDSGDSLAWRQYSISKNNARLTAAMFGKGVEYIAQWQVEI